ncbi:MAG TPA: sugar O-acetyltransferase [Clostridia bacterium]|jgi:galactoside O-acetyltransferase|nr:sugar O-acetyltransferase [Clostridia bacterium]
MTQKERREAGMLYNGYLKENISYQMKCIEDVYDFNNIRPQELEKKQELAKKMFGSMGDNCFIEGPIHSNWGCKHVFVGDNFYANFNLTLVDDAHIYIGNDVMLAPNVTIATAGHPIDPELRKQGYQFVAEVHIGNNVWIGAGAVIMPGVTIGDNSIIGAGSVVTKDIPANVVAFGVPCKVIRKIGEHDKIYYFKDRKIDWDTLTLD